MKSAMICFFKKNYFMIELILLSLAIFIHLTAAILTPTGDSAYFADFMTELLDTPIYGLYERHGLTYPPLFTYLYYAMAKLLAFGGVPFTWKSRLFVFAVKFPCICMVFAMYALVYHVAQKNISNIIARLFFLFLLLFNPGYLFITSYVCQVDALYVFFVLLTVYLLMNGRLKTAYFTFAAGIMFKFQTLFITPVLIAAIILQVILTDFSWKRFFSHLFTGLAAISCMLLLYLPFIYDFSAVSTRSFVLLLVAIVVAICLAAVIYFLKKKHFMEVGLRSLHQKPLPKCLPAGLIGLVCAALLCFAIVFRFDFSFFAEIAIIKNLTNALTGFGLASANAYNIWTLLGYNLQYDTACFGPFSCSTWGFSSIFLTMFLSFVLFFKEKNSPAVYPAVAAFLVSGIFCFSVRMMDRYLYATIILLFFACALHPTWKRFLSTIFFSITFFVNLYCNFIVYPYRVYNRSLIVPYIVSAFMLFCFGFSVYTLLSEKENVLEK